MKIDWCNSNENKKKSIYLVAMEIRLLFLLKNKFLLIFNDVSPAVCQSDEIFPWFDVLIGKLAGGWWGERAVPVGGGFKWTRPGDNEGFACWAFSWVGGAGGWPSENNRPPARPVPHAAPWTKLDRSIPPPLPICTYFDSVAASPPNVKVTRLTFYAPRQDDHCFGWPIFHFNNFHLN